MSLGEVSYGNDLAGSRATNGYLTLGQSAFGWTSGSGGAFGDQDWYGAYLQAGVNYTIEVQGLSVYQSSALPDAYLEIYDSNGVFFDSVGPDSFGDVYLNVNSPITGYVYFNVSGLGISDVGGYEIVLYTAPDDHGGNLTGGGVLPGATPIANAVVFTGTLERPGDVDSFSINATAGLRYFWAVSTTVPDLFATIDDAGYQRQTFGALPGAGSGELFAAESGTYMLSFSSNSFVGTGAYAVFVQAALSLDKKIVAGTITSDVLYGEVGADELWGWDGNDKIVAGGGADYLLGNKGNDTLVGGSGNDILWGDEQKDKLNGDSGNDRLIGGINQDTLTGGSGRDIFVFGNRETAASKKTADYITDFAGKYSDKIDLKGIDANVKARGDQAFVFIGKNGFTKAGQVRYEKTALETYVYLNTDSDASAEAVIRLKGAMDLQKSWFIL